MSDIVEMLVDAAGGNEAHVCAIAAAEIKRNLSQIEQLDARCGRLRDTCSTWERASNNYAEAVEIKDAEIERLRGELRERLSQDILDDALEEWKKENERLREENALLTKGWQPATPTALLDEIERLRGTQCNWTDEGGDCWETDCGHGFQFNDGGPADNSFTHCPFCGGELIVVQVDE